MESSEPPFQESYKALFENYIPETKYDNDLAIVEECDLPLIDLGRLNLGVLEREECKREIAKASQEWGFFQVVNHGISCEILEQMRREQVKVFKRPFCEKINGEYTNFAAGSYRWGTPSATCLRQLSWSEAFHVPLADISGLGGLTNLRFLMHLVAMYSESPLVRTLHRLAPILYHHHLLHLLIRITCSIVRTDIEMFFINSCKKIWKDNKNKIKKKCFKPIKHEPDIYSRVPHHIPPNQWRDLVDY